jgi:murein DD-endopeptidase MepM/ murein hydrolase activator NlpD
MTNKLILLLLLIPITAWSTKFPVQLAVPGGVALIPLGESSLPAPKAYFNKRRVLVMEQENHWLALVGIPLGTKPGTHHISLNPRNKNIQTRFTVTNKEYPAQYITIKNKRMVNPNPDDLKRIKADRIPINKALRTWTEQASIDTDFIAPVDGRLSSLFGLKRFFNNQPKNPHSGLDIAAPAGTPIKTPASAKVIDTGNYYYNGNTVILNHGQGLISGYFHMTDIHVKPGQFVKQGDLLGTVGETGRVTGPHLHWNIYLNRTKVDPALFIADEIPVLDARNNKDAK